MIVTLNWLKDFVNLDDKTPQQIAEAFTFAGFEVDEIIEKSKGMERVFVGKIEKIVKHPNADKLQICYIDLGNEKTQIITAAKNVFEGAFVPCALDGADLPNGVKITTSDMRGEKSCGMLCSGEELLIDNTVYPGAETDGIMILNEKDCYIGQNIANVIGYDDVVFDISVLSNRPDCQSVMGLAKELSVVFNREFKKPNISYDRAETDLPLTVENQTENCLYILGQVVTDVKIQPSPLWVQKRLKSVGLNSINNIVDLTNYVLWEIGQPMHAFDYSKLKGNSLIVRQAKENDGVLALDDNEYMLNNSNMVIADNSNVISIAGVKGGKEYSISSDTKNIVLEVASFKKESIRKTSRLIGLRTDASSRYERGVEPISCEIGLDRILSLIQEFKIGKICKTKHIPTKIEFSKRTIKFNLSKIKSLLGIEIPQEDIKRILLGLDIENEIKNNEINCKIPLIRADLQLPEDVIAEIIRIFGYEKINSTNGESQKCTTGGYDLKSKTEKTFREIMIQTSAYEVKTFTFVSPQNLDKLLIEADSPLRKQSIIKNALSFEYSAMRSEMLSSLLQTISFNEHHKTTDFSIYEIGKIFELSSDSMLPLEHNILAYITCEKNANFFTIKSVTEMIASKLNLTFNYQKSVIGYMHPNISAEILIGNIVIGKIGKIHPTVAKNFDINADLYYFELYLEKIPEKKIKKIKPLPKFPSSTRDLAIIVDEDVAVDSILKTVKKFAGKDCENIEFFDVYTGNQVEKGKKSVAIRLVFRKSDGTLTQDEVNNYIEKVLDELGKNYKAKLRE